MTIIDKLMDEYGPDKKLKYVGSIWGKMPFTMTVSELQDELAGSEYNTELDDKNETVPAEEYDEKNTWDFGLDEVRVSGDKFDEVVFTVVADDSEMDHDLDKVGNPEDETTDNDLENPENLENGNAEAEQTQESVEMKKLEQYVNEKTAKVKEKPFKNIAKTTDTIPEPDVNKAPKMPAKGTKAPKLGKAEKKDVTKKVKVPEAEPVDHSIFVKGDCVTTPGGICGKITGTEVDKETKAVKYKITLDNGEKVVYPEADITRATTPVSKVTIGRTPLKTFESYLK